MQRRSRGQLFDTTLGAAQRAAGALKPTPDPADCIVTTHVELRRSDGMLERRHAHVAIELLHPATKATCNIHVTISLRHGTITARLDCDDTDYGAPPPAIPEGTDPAEAALTLAAWTSASRYRRAAIHRLHFWPPVSTKE